MLEGKEICIHHGKNTCYPVPTGYFEYQTTFAILKLNTKRPEKSFCTFRVVRTLSLMMPHEPRFRPQFRF